MKKSEEKELFDMMYNGMLRQQEKATTPPKEKKISVVEKIHLNIQKAIRFINGKMGVRQRASPQRPVKVKDPKKTAKYDAMVSIVATIVGYSIVGGFAVFLLLLFSPIKGWPLVDVLKDNIGLEVLAVFVGAGCLFYLIVDFAELVGRFWVLGRNNK